MKEVEPLPQKKKYALSNLTVSGRVRCPKSAQPSPRAYAITAEGDCLLPEYKSGDIMVFDPEKPPELGDLVVIWWKDETIQPLIKRLLLPLPPKKYWEAGGEAQMAICVEMLNPPETFIIKTSDVAAVHKVIHVIRT
ncbi:MAG: S24 family peptidase [Pseudomonas putida]|jgi:phage repressor protein C with HTH and peptisase S24 domain|nr:S24 family peptidase [Pseudomonas putida]